MFWIICGSVFAGFLLGVTFMAVFAISREATDFDRAEENVSPLLKPADQSHTGAGVSGSCS